MSDTGPEVRGKPRNHPLRPGPPPAPAQSGQGDQDGGEQELKDQDHGRSGWGWGQCGPERPGTVIPGNPPSEFDKYHAYN